MPGRPHFLSPKLRSWPWIGIILGVLTWLLLLIFKASPLFTEVIYSQGIFAIIRTIWDYTLGWLPFPWSYLAVPLLLFLAIRAIRKREKEKLVWHVRLRRILLSLIGFFGVIMFLFYFSWGFNYQRVSIEDRLRIEVDSLTLDGLREEYRLATMSLLKADSVLGTRTTSITEEDLPDNLESYLRTAEKQWLTSQDLSAPGRPRGRRVFPKGMLMQLGASGIYIPFVAEGHIDASLPPVMRPSTMAHELGHAFGYGDEGTCNFLGWATCVYADHPVVQYSGRLAYWRETANRLGRIERDSVLADIEKLPVGIQADLAEIKAVREKYPGFFPQVSTAIYDEYLQAQGIEEGMLNYARVIHLVKAWRKTFPQ